MRENADQNNSEYGHFSESVILMLNIWRWDIFAGFQLTVFEKKCSFRKISKYSHCDALQKVTQSLHDPFSANRKIWHHGMQNGSHILQYLL